MKISITLLLILPLLFASCFGGTDLFDKAYYERVTGVTFPEKYGVLETFDNGEFLTGALLELDSLALRNFIVQNRLDTVRKKVGLGIISWSVGYYRTEKPEFADNELLFSINKSKGKVNWTYIAEPKKNRLWAVINYPDWGGQ